MPGANVAVEMSGVEELHAEVSAKGYRYLRPGIVTDEFGTHLNTIDPFHNRIRFTEPGRK